MRITGMVQKGSGRGKELGYPTANLDVSPEAEEGVFVGYTRINNAPQIAPTLFSSPLEGEDVRRTGEGCQGSTSPAFGSLPMPGEGGKVESIPPLKIRGGEGELFPSLIFIGAPETFGDGEKRLEAYILDFAGDLYGQEITVEIIHKLRDNRKFDSAETLVEQMKFDELAARKYFGL